MRVSLFGGGLDYPEWFRDHGGAVLGFTIDKYCYISLRKLPPFFDYKHRLVWSKIETVNKIAEIQHPVIKAVFSERGLASGVELHHAADLPARSGLGSSSAFTVGLLHALYAINGHMVAPGDLAREAIRIERDILQETVGWQDQIWAAHGGFNVIEFTDDFRVNPVIIHRKRRDYLNDHLMLFFTGFARNASVIEATKLGNYKAKEQNLLSMRHLVTDALNVLYSSGPLDDIGRMLAETWKHKRSLAGSVSTLEIDDIYNMGISAGATGGKLLGAGGGGFMLFFVSPEKRAAVSKALSHLVQVNFKIGSEGSRVVLYEPNGI